MIGKIEVILGFFEVMVKRGGMVPSSPVANLKDGLEKRTQSCGVGKVFEPCQWGKLVPVFPLRKEEMYQLIR
jgi:hypothetical protein